MRKFNTGATRDTDESKIDYEGFLSPSVLERYGQYMHTHRIQADGTLRDSDNWQKGIPIEAYMKSMWRHFFTVWNGYRLHVIPEEELCALMFNAMGMLHEILKTNRDNSMESNPENVEMVVTQEILDANPEIVDAGYVEGDVLMVAPDEVVVEETATPVDETAVTPEAGLTNSASPETGVAYTVPETTTE